jgi:CheY-like chemotaxis protein
MSQSRQGGERQQPVVMVIDDNPAIRDMVSWALELDGFEPAEAAEGQEALDWLWNAVNEGRTPAVILLDLAMPGMDGAQFLEQMHERWQRDYPSHPLPSIVVITAGTHGPDASSLGVERIIIKPFHVRDLLDIVRRLVY